MKTSLLISTYNWPEALELVQEQPGDVQHLFAARRIRAVDPHTPRLNDVQAAARIAGGTLTWAEALGEGLEVPARLRGSL